MWFLTLCVEWTVGLSVRGMIETLGAKDHVQKTKWRTKEIVELSTDGGETCEMEEEDKAGTWGRGCEKGWGPGNLGASATAAALKQKPWTFSPPEPRTFHSV